MCERVRGKVSKCVSFPLQLPPIEIKLGPEYWIHSAASSGPCIAGVDKGLELRRPNVVWSGSYGPADGSNECK